LLEVQLPQNLSECLVTPLWKNLTLTKDPIFVNNWYMKGVKFVGDILDSNLNILNMERIIEKYETKAIS